MRANGDFIEVGRRYYQAHELLPGQDLATTARWSNLVDELDRWGDAGRVATLWWRDDDAVAASARLDRLVSIAGDIPISLAVIPAAADPGLAAWLTQPSRSPKQGALLSFSTVGATRTTPSRARRTNFRPERSRHAVAFDLVAGRARLTALFGARALAVLAPPWNRFDPCFLPLLAACGFGAISCMKPRRAALAARPASPQINVHVDLVAWAGDRGFIGEGAALDGLIGHLRGRRLGEVDAEEPTGILTHHLVHDEATDAFLRRLVAITGAHPATCWLDAAEVFAGALSAHGR